MGVGKRLASRILRVIIGLFPLVAMTCLITTGYCLSLNRKRRINRIRAWRQGYASVEQDFEASLPDRLVNPQRYDEKNRPLDPIGFD